MSFKRLFFGGGFDHSECCGTGKPEATKTFKYNEISADEAKEKAKKRYNEINQATLTEVFDAIQLAVEKGRCDTIVFKALNNDVADKIRSLGYTVRINLHGVVSPNTEIIWDNQGRRSPSW